MQTTVDIPGVPVVLTLDLSNPSYIPLLFLLLHARRRHSRCTQRRLRNVKKRLPTGR